MTNNNLKINPNKGQASRGRTPDGDPNPIDMHVGSQIRMRRNFLGLSQEKLGQLIGLTFQQIQKYERGTNRIGASRLWDLKNVLRLESTDYFFSNMPEDIQGQSPRMFKLNCSIPEMSEEYAYTENLQDPMTRKDVMEIATCYIKLAKRNPSLAAKIHDLIEAMAKTTFGDNNPEDAYDSI